MGIIISWGGAHTGAHTAVGKLTARDDAEIVEKNSEIAAEAVSSVEEKSRERKVSLMRQM